MPNLLRRENLLCYHTHLQSSNTVVGKLWGLYICQGTFKVACTAHSLTFFIQFQLFLFFPLKLADELFLLHLLLFETLRTHLRCEELCEQIRL